MPVTVARILGEAQRRSDLRWVPARSSRWPMMARALFLLGPEDTSLTRSKMLLGTAWESCALEHRSRGVTARRLQGRDRSDSNTHKAGAYRIFMDVSSIGTTEGRYPYTGILDAGQHRQHDQDALLPGTALLTPSFDAMTTSGPTTPGLLPHPCGSHPTCILPRPTHTKCYETPTTPIFPLVSIPGRPTERT